MFPESAAQRNRPRAGRRIAPRRGDLLAALGAAAALSAGCKAQRTMHVTSVPPGAAVRIDDIFRGTTPLDQPFTYYGTHHIALTLDGHRTWADVVRVKAPWYARFPLDYISEVLIPIGWHHDPSLEVVLEPGVQGPGRPDLRSVLERADVLRGAGPDGPEDLPELRHEPSLTMKDRGSDRGWVQRWGLDRVAPDAFIEDYLDPRAWDFGFGWSTFGIGSDEEPEEEPRKLIPPRSATDEP